ncbi:MAG: 4Fe-4S dicluster domain-containing protein [Ignavibacteria bacterium]|jgi:ferredoxin|nr:4Fe-4S dicluster domain-containing protein [Ignavibacteria bacterium]MCU7504825.1 4Fe-4S dicluster domain-containing protein [Ignavibacteria bacterium]MCU7517711.1 4Fe-4S dicluster domain-containing protein [Ignavibacteria bacterium]
MAIMITEECINCGACEPECPNNAIYEGGSEWVLGGKNYGEGDAAPSGATRFVKNDFFYIVPDKCTECVGFHDEPQCAAVCPVDCCVPDPNHVEEKDTLMAKKEELDAVGR